MSQNIECTNCHDVITLEGGRTIEIPFVCNPCRVEAEPVESNYEASAEGEPELEHDFATTENTTILINDLSDQLAASQETVTVLVEKLTQAEEFIGAEVDRSTKFLEDLTNLTQRNAELELEAEGLRTAAAKLLKAFLEKIEL
jgi:hypothetical protein